jgi:protein-S-isoprenylcysteine O-methyltransferase Ste14
MAAASASVWVVVSRWERPGHGAKHRVKLRAPPIVRWGFDVGLFGSLAYPVLVVIAPASTYEGWANWSSNADRAVQAVGLVLWMLGIAVLLWASRVMGGHLAIDGLGEDHELVTDGPYRYVRHPVYASFVAISVGTALVFRSYAVLGMSVLLLVTGRWWANAEERLLGSTEGFGDAYTIYAARTGRFVPRLGGRGAR